MDSEYFKILFKDIVKVLIFPISLSAFLCWGAYFGINSEKDKIKEKLAESNLGKYEINKGKIVFSLLDQTTNTLPLRKHLEN